MAIWALVTASDGENVPEPVPLVIPRAAMQPMSAARAESAGTSSKDEPASSGQARPAAAQARAKNAAICARVTGSDGENILSAVPRATPRADTQSMPAA